MPNQRLADENARQVCRARKQVLVVRTQHGVGQRARLPSSFEEKNIEIAEFTQERISFGPPECKYVVFRLIRDIKLLHKGGYRKHNFSPEVAWNYGFARLERSEIWLLSQTYADLFRKDRFSAWDLHNAQRRRNSGIRKYIERVLGIDARTTVMLFRSFAYHPQPNQLGCTCTSHRPDLCTSDSFYRCRACFCGVVNDLTEMRLLYIIRYSRACQLDCE